MPPEEVSYTFAWHALSDSCPKCQHLDGREWPEQNIYQNTLFDYLFGDVWDLNNDHSLAHPNCRCQLELRVHIDMNKMDSLTELIDLMDLLGG